MRRPRWAAGVACVVALAGAGTSSASAAVPRNFYGIVQFAPLDSGDYARMGTAKVGTLRIQILWGGVEHSRGKFDFAPYDNVVAQAASNGVEVLPVLFGTPKFESGCSSVLCQRHIITSPQALNDWQAFVHAAAKRYGSKGSFWQQNPSIPKHPIVNWQFWNEQNNPSQNNSAKAYTKLVKSGAAGLRSADGKGKVMLGGMFGTPPNSPKNNAWTYLNTMYNAGAKSAFDSVALQPYAVKPPDIKEPIEKMRAVMKKHGDASAKLYVTEIGWGSSKKKHPGTGGRGALFNVSPKKQEQYLQASFETLTSHRSSWKIGGVDWFTWKDPTNPRDGLCAFCYSAGLFEAGGTKAKPSFGAFKGFTKKTRGKRVRSAAAPQELPELSQAVPSLRRLAQALL